MENIGLDFELISLMTVVKSKLKDLFDKGLEIDSIRVEIDELKKFCDYAIMDKTELFTKVISEVKKNPLKLPDSEIEDYQRNWYLYKLFIEDIARKIRNYWDTIGLYRYHLFIEIEKMRRDFIDHWYIKQGRDHYSRYEGFSDFVVEVYERIKNNPNYRFSLEDLEHAFEAIEYQFRQDERDWWNRSENDPKYYKLRGMKKFIDRIKPKDFPCQRNDTRHMKKLIQN